MTANCIQGFKTIEGLFRFSYASLHSSSYTRLQSVLNNQAMTMENLFIAFLKNRTPTDTAALQHLCHSSIPEGYDVNGKGARCRLFKEVATGVPSISMDLAADYGAIEVGCTILSPPSSF